MLSNKTYDFLKWVSLVFILVAGTPFFAIAEIWQLPYIETATQKCIESSGKKITTLVESETELNEKQSAELAEQNKSIAEQRDVLYAQIEKQNEILKQQEEAIAKYQEQITSHQDFIDNLESSQLMRDILNKLKEKEAVVNNTYVTNEYITQVIQEVIDRLDFIENKWCAFFIRGVHAYANGLPKTIYDVEGDEYIIKQGVRCYKDSVGDIYYAVAI